MAGSTERQVWFITGVSRGLGHGIAEAVLASGRAVVGTVRRDGDAADLANKYPGQVLLVTADVTHQASVAAAVTAAVEFGGRIDVFVSNAGYTLVAGIEDATDQQIRDQFETNAFGTINVTRSVLPVMRKQQAGRVIVVSSVAGASAGPGMGYYAASKHAVEGFAESLSKEVATWRSRSPSSSPGCSGPTPSAPRCGRCP